MASRNAAHGKGDCGVERTVFDILYTLAVGLSTQALSKTRPVTFIMPCTHGVLSWLHLTLEGQAQHKLKLALDKVTLARALRIMQFSPDIYQRRDASREPLIKFAQVRKLHVGAFITRVPA